jgi:glycosyltransferase involved in cell wall biosynthesis
VIPEIELQEGAGAQPRPRVSIITPTFQHQSFIRTCLESVLAQENRLWELIVVDDASSDRTVEIVEQYLARDQRIRLVRHAKNYGIARLSDSYNEALALCRGELVAVLEGDDEWMPGKLAAQLPVFQDRRVVLCYGDYDQVTPEGLLIVRHGISDAIAQERSSPRDNLAYFSRLKGLGSATVVVRRSELVRMGGFTSGDLPLVDYPTWLRLAACGDFVRVPKVLARWRRHHGSVYYAQEFAIMERLRQHFVSYLETEQDQLMTLGFTGADLTTLKANSAMAVQQKQRSRHYYEGKYRLLFGDRWKAMGSLSRAVISPATPLRHRVGALVGMLAALTSPRLLLQLGRLTRMDPEAT